MSCTYHHPLKSTYLRVSTQILRAAETEVPHLQNHIKEMYSKGILFCFPFPQTLAVTGRVGLLVLKHNPLARHEENQTLSANYFGWMFQAWINLHKLTGAERAGHITQLPLKQVTFKMKGASIQAMQSSIWHTQENRHYCHPDIELPFIRTYAICLGKMQHALWMHPLGSPQLIIKKAALTTAFTEKLKP